jgi:hypothetical protein
MLDVHAPHQRMAGFKDFLLHLFTITVGLLIALSLEGCVEWRHHRQLVSEAETALTHETAQNQKTLDSLRQPIKDQQKQLDDDVATLSKMRADPATKDHSLSFGFAMHTFDNVAWKTAQATGAFAYMPYKDASAYANIYGAQELLVQSEQQVIDAVLSSASIPSGQGPDWKPTPAQMDELTDRVGMLEMRLSLLSSFVDAQDKSYRDYAREHPGSD